MVFLIFSLSHFFFLTDYEIRCVYRCEAHYLPHFSTKFLTILLRSIVAAQIGNLRVTANLQKQLICLFLEKLPRKANQTFQAVNCLLNGFSDFLVFGLFSFPILRRRAGNLRALYDPRILAPKMLSSLLNSKILL